MNKTPRWLTNSIVFLVVATSSLAIGWAASCTIRISTDPQLEQLELCQDADNRAIQVMMALLATMIGLRSNPPE